MLRAGMAKSRRLKRSLALLVAAMWLSGCSDGRPRPASAADATVIAPPTQTAPPKPLPRWPVFEPNIAPPPLEAPVAADPIPGEEPPEATGGALQAAGPTVASMAGGFRRCYNRALHDDPTMRGKVRLTAKIGGDGTVIIVSDAAGEGLSPQLVDCLKRRLIAQRFHPPDGGGATLVVPFSFEPQK